MDKKLEPHCSVLAWESSGQRGLAGYSVWGHNETTAAATGKSDNKIITLKFSSGKPILQLVKLIAQEKYLSGLFLHSFIF